MAKTGKATADVDFGKELKELEAIVAWFEDGNGDLDESLKKFERGMELATTLKDYLATVENKVEVIRKKFDAPTSKNVADASETLPEASDLFNA